MTRYTVLDKTFINGMICERGDVVEYDGTPGSTLQPVETKPSVDIPDGWQNENGLKRIALARSLGAPKQRMSGSDADQWIRNELANREAKAAEKKTAPSLFGGPSATPTPEPKPTSDITVPSTPSSGNL